jgi:hypothetical protein
MKARPGSLSRTAAVAYLVGFVVLGISGVATAQDYPTKAVNMIIGMDPCTSA